MFERLVHDLKGPLSPLQTAAYLLKRPDLPDDRRVELADTVERQSRRMASMIEELGDWVRAREERMVLRRRPVEVGMAIDLAIGAVAGCQTHPDLAVDVADATVDGDDSRLVQALASLLAYAQSRDARSPRLQASRNGNRLLIVITDAGPNLDIPGRLLLDPLPEPYDLGLGLRLIVAEAIIREHCGTLTARPLAPGLAFEIELPLVAVV